jgi:hypothetical protein
VWRYVFVFGLSLYVYTYTYKYLERKRERERRAYVYLFPRVLRTNHTHIFIFIPQLGLAIRGSNWILKQPVGCAGLRGARVPRGLCPGAWFPSLEPPEPGSQAPNLKISKSQLSNIKCQKWLKKIFWHCLVVKINALALLSCQHKCFGIA